MPVNGALWVALVAQLVIILLFYWLHYKVDPAKEAKKFKQEQLTRFYGPLYANLLARGIFAKNSLYYTEGENPDRLLFGEGSSSPEYVTRAWLERFIHENSGYANGELLLAWANYVSAFDRRVLQNDVDKLCKEIVKGYNLVKKNLNLDYDEAELRTGIPTIYAHLRKENPK